MGDEFDSDKPGTDDPGIQWPKVVPPAPIAPPRRVLYRCGHPYCPKQGTSPNPDIFCNPVPVES